VKKHFDRIEFREGIAGWKAKTWMRENLSETLLE